MSSKQRYEVKVTLGKDWQGNLIRRSFYSTKSRADAKKKGEKYRAQYELELLCGGEPVKSVPLFKDWAITCIQNCKRGYVTPGTYTGCWLQPVNLHLIPYFGDKPINEILPIHIQNYVNQATKTYKPETIKRDVSILSFVFEHGIANGLCQGNPAKKIQLPKIERANKTAYTQEEYDIVYEFAKTHPDGLAILMMLSTGVSRSELLGLRWQDFDSEKGEISIRQGLVSYVDEDEGCVTGVSNLKNSYRKRTIPIVEPELLKQLRAKPHKVYFSTGSGDAKKTVAVDTEYIFSSPRGKPYQPNNWDNRVFKPFMKSLHAEFPEVPVLSAHELRHTRATLWISQGVPPMMVARLLGHADLSMVMRIYDHTNVNTLRKALVASEMKQ